jgi:hypothetical protein
MYRRRRRQNLKMIRGREKKEVYKEGIKECKSKETEGVYDGAGNEKV